MLILFTLIILSSCGYRILEDDSGKKTLVFPDGTKYYSWRLSHYCFNRGFAAKGETLAQIPCPYCDEEEECKLDIFLPPNASNDDIVLVDYAFLHGLDGRVGFYIKEGTERPSILSKDKIEAMSYFTKEEFFTEFCMEDDTEKKNEILKDKPISIDFNDFAQGMLEYEHDYDIDRLDGYDLCGRFIYKFENTGDLYFNLFVAYSKDKHNFAVEGIVDDDYRIYYIPEDYFAGVIDIPKEVDE